MDLLVYATDFAAILNVANDSSLTAHHVNMTAHNGAAGVSGLQLTVLTLSDLLVRHWYCRHSLPFVILCHRSSVARPLRFR